jgi:hypothetical protein
MPEAWELRKKGYPTPAKASTQERFRARDSMPRCQTGKGAVRLLGFRRFGPPPPSVHVTEVNLGHKLETFPGG